MQLTNIPKNIPDSPGVYFFRKSLSKKGKPLYIGKATSLKERVRSYFLGDIIKARGRRVLQMVEEAKSIDFIPTDSVLEALLLEAVLIKKYQPKFNANEKDNKSFNYIGITKDNYPKILLVRGRKLEQTRSEYKYIFGPYPASTNIKEALKIIRRILPYRDKCKEGDKKPCFYMQIGMCPGVCTGDITKREYGNIIKNIRLFLEGKKNRVLKNLESEMKTFSRKKEFEKAEIIKRRIFALNHIRDIALLKKEISETDQSIRIESYDIAHISGTSVVGAMCVMSGNFLSKKDYRKFKIRGSEKNNDTANLEEILRRRLSHKEWILPNVIVVDGGKAQINVARKVFKNENLNIPVVGVVKGKNHKASKIIGSPTIINKYKDSIVKINVETHRFTISYHKKVRKHILS